MTASVSFRTSWFLKSFLFSDTVFKNENASFSLDICMLLESKQYRQGEGARINFIRGTLPCLYYFNASNIHMSILKLALLFLNTVSENKKLFKNQEVQKATDAVMLNQKTNHNAKEMFVRIVKDNWN